MAREKDKPQKAIRYPLGHVQRVSSARLFVVDFAESTLLWLGDGGRVVSRDDGSGPCSEVEKAAPSALYGSSLRLDDDRISCACALLSLLRCLDVPSVPLIAILDSAMDLGGGGATGRHGGGEGSSGNREDVFELRLGLQRCEQDRGVCDC